VATILLVIPGSWCFSLSRFTQPSNHAKGLDAGDFYGNQQGCQTTPV
jgi:hypothetical protein